MKVIINLIVFIVISALMYGFFETDSNFIKAIIVSIVILYFIKALETSLENIINGLNVILSKVDKK